MRDFDGPNGVNLLATSTTMLTTHAKCHHRMQSHVFSWFSSNGKSGFSSSWYFVKTNTNGRTYKYLREKKTSKKWLQNITFIKLVQPFFSIRMQKKWSFVMILFLRPICLFERNAIDADTFFCHFIRLSPILNAQQKRNKWWGNAIMTSFPWHKINLSGFSTIAPTDDNNTFASISWNWFDSIQLQSLRNYHSNKLIDDFSISCQKKQIHSFIHSIQWREFKKRKKNMMTNSNSMRKRNVFELSINSHQVHKNWCRRHKSSASINFQMNPIFKRRTTRC